MRSRSRSAISRRQAGWAVAAWATGVRVRVRVRVRLNPNPNPNPNQDTTCDETMVAWQAWRRHKRGVGRRGAGRHGVGRRGAARWALRRTRRTWVGLRVGGVTVMVTARCPGWVPRNRCVGCKSCSGSNELRQERFVFSSTDRPAARGEETRVSLDSRHPLRVVAKLRWRVATGSRCGAARLKHVGCHRATPSQRGAR